LAGEKYGPTGKPANGLTQRKRRDIMEAGTTYLTKDGKEISREEYLALNKQAGQRTNGQTGKPENRPTGQRANRKKKEE